ncbi:unnamed protein product [Lota lota]
MATSPIARKPQPVQSPENPNQPVQSLKNPEKVYVAGGPSGLPVSAGPLDICGTVCGVLGPSGTTGPLVDPVVERHSLKSGWDPSSEAP